MNLNDGLLQLLTEIGELSKCRDTLAGEISRLPSDQKNKTQVLLLANKTIEEIISRKALEVTKQWPTQDQSQH